MTKKPRFQKCKDKVFIGQFFTLIVLSFLLASCKNYDNYYSTKLSFPVYGNYCGPLYPPKGSTPIPIDSVDNACKNHDACYDNFGYLNKNCDQSIINELESIYTNSPQEELMRKLLIAYFTNVQNI